MIRHTCLGDHPVQVPENLGQPTHGVGRRSLDPVWCDVAHGEKEIVIVNGGPDEEPVERGLPRVGPNLLG